MPRTRLAVARVAPSPCGGIAGVVSMRRLTMAHRPPRLPLPLFALLLCAPSLAQTKLTGEQVQAMAQRAFEKLRPPGMALCVVQDGELLVELAFGERKPGSTVTPETAFNIASCSKAFTTALMAQLVHEGKLAWDDRVVDRLPGFRMSDPWITAHMTLRDLLCHRCGLVTFAGDLLWYGTDYSDAEVLRRMERLPVKNRFREQFGYQNLMYMAAGMVMERVTGKNWEELVEERLLRPLQMNQSHASLQRVPADADRAAPYIDGIEIPDVVFTACKPAAAIYSSVHDLAAWVRMWLAGGAFGERQVVDKNAVNELWRPHTAIGRGTGAAAGDFRGYGLGWFLNLEGAKKLVEHDGGMPGFLSKVSLLPADKFGFAVLNNGSDGVVNEAIKRALLAMRGGGDGIAVVDDLARVQARRQQMAKAAEQKRVDARLPETKPSLIMAAYAGRYVDATYGPAEVQYDGDQLKLTLLPAKTRLFGNLSHWHQDTFRVDFPDRFLPFALVRFELDSSGKVAAFAIDCPIDDFDFAALDFRRERQGQSGH